MPSNCLGIFTGISGPFTADPRGPWVNPWIIFLATWAGILTAIALAVLVWRNAGLRLMGTTDALTGVYNRNSGDLAVGKYLEVHEGKPPLVMAVVDIDNFKIINDVYGHEAGHFAILPKTKKPSESIFFTRTGSDASSRLIKIMECGNLDDFMNYTCSHVFRLFPQG